jgi:hypothetical protein
LRGHLPLSHADAICLRLSARTNHPQRISTISGFRWKVVLPILRARSQQCGRIPDVATRRRGDQPHHIPSIEAPSHSQPSDWRNVSAGVPIRLELLVKP